MGQINCQQCLMPNSIQINQTQSKPNKDQSKTNIIQKVKPNDLHRINVLCRNNNVVQNFGKKLSIQSTIGDISQSSRSKNTYTRQKCTLKLSNALESISIQIQKSKKIFVGTSNNCHFQLENLSSQIRNFKFSVMFTNNGIQIKDMGIGEGSFRKQSVLNLHSPEKLTSQLFQIQNLYFRISYTLSKGSQIYYKFVIQQMSYKNESVFMLTEQDFSQNNSFDKFINTNQDLTKISFKCQINQKQEKQIKFLNKDCWKYIKDSILVKQDDILKIGSSIFKINQMKYSFQSQIKIIDQQFIQEQIF